jgi:hypothetical protein
MDNITFKDILLIIGSLSGPIFAFFIYNMHKKSLRNLSMFNIIETYRSAEMYLAIKMLWQLYRECGENQKQLIEKYLEIINTDAEKIKEIDDIAKNREYQLNSLDHYRRMVTQYFDYMAFCFGKNIIQKNYIKELWRKTSLEIIPNILVPLDFANAKHVARRDYKDINHFISLDPAIKKKLDLYNYVYKNN